MRRSDIEEIEGLIDTDPTEAVAFGRTLVKEAPADPDCWGWLAEAQMEARDYDGALKSLAEYLKRDPDWMEAYTLRAGLLSELGRFDAAGVELEVARSLDSEDPRLTRAEASWHEWQGHFERADELYNRAAQVDPSVLPPKRFDRAVAKAAILVVLKEVAKDGLKLTAEFAEVPTVAGKDKFLSRPIELRDAGTLVVYLRNLERELTVEAEIDDLKELFEDFLAALVEAN